MDQLRKTLSTQLEEIECLKSMFNEPDALRIQHPHTLDTIRSFIADEHTTDVSILPPNIELIMNMAAAEDGIKYEVQVSLPHSYPINMPDFFVRSECLTKDQHTRLNCQLRDHLATNWTEEPCLFDIITWLNEHISLVSGIEQPEFPSFSSSKIDCQLATKCCVRFWIYAHHIYSTTKRQEMLRLARHLNLNGFCLPGKPGIVCIEGPNADCNEWWQRIKSMNWKRITCVLSEQQSSTEDPHDFHRFPSFTEICLQNNTSKSSSMNMSEVRKFLSAHRSAYIFKYMFGIDAKEALAGESCE